MAITKATIFSHRQERGKLQPDQDLEKVAEEFIGRHGGKSLGDLDTPAFMRRVCQVVLLSQKWNRSPRPAVGETTMASGSRALSC